MYDGILYVLANNGVLDAYEVETGKEISRQRIEPVGSGFSASPVAADGRIYLTSEDGAIIVIAAGREFRKLGSSSMGELVMATPALSDGRTPTNRGYPVVATLVLICQRARPNAPIAHVSLSAARGPRWGFNAGLGHACGDNCR